MLGSRAVLGARLRPERVSHVQGPLSDDFGIDVALWRAKPG
jgi:hypothetical protein